MIFGINSPSGAFSITIATFIAGASISTAALGLSNRAPSMMFAQYSRSSSPFVSHPKPVLRPYVRNQPCAGDISRIEELPRPLLFLLSGLEMHSRISGVKNALW